jgi:hypothetical protein
MKYKLGINLICPIEQEVPIVTLPDNAVGVTLSMVCEGKTLQVMWLEPTCDKQ